MSRNQNRLDVDGALTDERRRRRSAPEFDNNCNAAGDDDVNNVHLPTTIATTMTAGNKEEDDAEPATDMTSQFANARRKSIAPAEISFDDNGQTWDVYGAELDPEILGSAIQCHLERIMTSSSSSMSTTAAAKTASGLLDNVAEDPVEETGSDVDDDDVRAIDATRRISMREMRITDCVADDVPTSNTIDCNDRNRKPPAIHNRKLLLCGGKTSRPGCDDDDDGDADDDDGDPGGSGAGQRGGFLARISCLLSRRKQKRMDEYRPTPNYC